MSKIECVKESMWRILGSRTQWHNVEAHTGALCKGPDVSTTSSVLYGRPQASSHELLDLRPIYGLSWERERESDVLEACADNRDEF